MNAPFNCLTPCLTGVTFVLYIQTVLFITDNIYRLVKLLDNSMIQCQKEHKMTTDKKTDVRSMYTQSLIENAFIEILSKKSIKEITVKELTSKANVSRGTFYNQFVDIYDVYQTIEDRYFDEIIKRVYSNKVYAFDDGFFKDIIYYVFLNKTWFKIIFSNIEASSLANRIIIFVKNKFIQDYKELNPLMNTESLETIFTYSITGSLGIISQWLKKDADVAPDVLAREITRLIRTTYEGFSKAERLDK